MKRTLLGLTVALCLIILLVVIGIEQQQVQSLRRETQTLQTQNQNNRQALERMSTDLGKAMTELAHPTLRSWGIETTLKGSGWYTVSAVPDTFDYLISFESDVPVRVSIFDFPQYVSFAQCGRSCVHGSYADWAATTSMTDQTFTLAEGCADYVVVFEAQGRGNIRPDVRVRYNPASEPTGACAIS